MTRVLVVERFLIAFLVATVSAMAVPFQTIEKGHYSGIEVSMFTGYDTFSILCVPSHHYFILLANINIIYRRPSLKFIVQTKTLQLSGVDTLPTKSPPLMFLLLILHLEWLQ